MNLPKLDNSNLWDKTYTVLKDLIVRREFKPNEKLSIPDLSIKLGVSRTPIRDALTRLEMEGLVKTVSKVGTFINSLEIADILDIIDTRLMIEYWVVGKLPALHEKDYLIRIKQLEDILDEACNTVERMPLGSFLRSDYNLRFHIEFVKMGNNQKNVDIYLAMMNYHYLAAENSLFTPEMVTSAIGQHKEMIMAIKSRDFETLKTAIKLHLNDSKDRLIERLMAGGGQL